MAIPFALLFGAISAYDNGWRVGVLTGVGGGALLGLGSVLINAVYKRLARPRPPSFPGETVVKSGAAQELIVGGDAAAGWLYLTPKALHFRLDRFVQQPQNWSIRLADVTGVEATRAFGDHPERFHDRDGHNDHPPGCEWQLRLGRGDFICQRRLRQ